MRLILWFVLMLLGAGPAAAHAMLVGMEPAQGSVLDRQPDHVVLHFMQPVTVLRAELISPASLLLPVHVQSATIWSCRCRRTLAVEHICCAGVCWAVIRIRSAAC